MSDLNDEKAGWTVDGLLGAVERLTRRAEAADAEVERWCVEYGRQHDRADRLAAENRDLRARLAAVEALPGWLTDVERLAANIYYTTGVDGLRWSLLSSEAQNRFREMARKIVKYLPLASVPAVDAGEVPERRCSQCGHGFSERACGPTHALLYHEKMRAAVDADDREPASFYPRPVTLSELGMTIDDVIRRAEDAARAAEPSSGQPEGDGTSGGFEAVTEAHSDASEVCQVCGTSEATGWVGDTCDRCARPCFCGSPGAYSLTPGERVMHAADECVIVRVVQP